MAGTYYTVHTLSSLVLGGFESGVTTRPGWYLTLDFLIDIRLRTGVAFVNCAWPFSPAPGGQDPAHTTGLFAEVLQSACAHRS